jgi:ribosomal protein L11 methyltransferase
MKPRIIEIAPFWRIVPSSGMGEVDPRAVGRCATHPPHDGMSSVPLIILPGTAFGDGTHETTQLCLQAIAALAPRAAADSRQRFAQSWRMPDFGSGSGILAIAAAKLGATVEAIEIDEKAIEQARENARANGIWDRVVCARSLESACRPADLVVANILRSVLLAFAEQLVSHLADRATLVLSGLVSTDVPEVAVRYGALLDGRRPEVYERDHWRALVWRGCV